MRLLGKLMGLTELYEARFVFDRHDLSRVEVEIEACRAFEEYIQRSAMSREESAMAPQLTMIQLAYGHWAKNLFNLGGDPGADILNFDIEARAVAIGERAPYKGTFIEQFPLPLVSGIRWRTVLCIKRDDTVITNTEVPVQGNVSVMAPASVLALFDRVLNSLDDQTWRGGFLAGIGAMLGCYDEHGHRRMKMIDVAVHLGMAAAIQTKMTLDGSAT